LEDLAAFELLEHPDRVRPLGDLVLAGLQAAEATPGEREQDEAHPAPDHPSLVEQLGHFHDALVSRHLDHPRGIANRARDAQDPPAPQEQGEHAPHDPEPDDGPPGGSGVPGPLAPGLERSRSLHHDFPYSGWTSIISQTASRRMRRCANWDADRRPAGA